MNKMNLMVVIGMVVLVGVSVGGMLKTKIDLLTADAIPEVADPFSAAVPAGVFNGTSSGTIMALIPLVFIVGILLYTLVFSKKNG